MIESESLFAYVPPDRLHAMAGNTKLPAQAGGAALFADISGFTPLTEALVLALGPQRGAEELPRQLNRVYNALVAEVDRYGGSVLGFSGDAITCWFAETDERSDAVDRAAACALAIQAAMRQFTSLAIPGAGNVSLAVKVSIAAGTARRFPAGDPAIQLIDVLAGTLLDRLAGGESLAEKGEIIIDEPALAALGPRALIGEWRDDPAGSGRFAVLHGLNQTVAPAPWPPLDETSITAEQLRPWMLPPVYERLQSGLGEFLTELRTAAALFMRFGGIDFDQDPLAALKLDTFVRLVQRVLLGYEAYLLQLTIGDKGCYLYAAFGTPVAHENDAVRACLAALELREPRLDFITAIQIGISLGRMRTGAYGALGRRTYGSLGDEVNLAARLMQYAAPGQIMVSMSARRPTGDRFTWEELAPIQVKGKAAPVAVSRLIGIEERRSFHFHEPVYRLPMVGRAAELASINEALEQALQGHGRIVGIVAEAGLGKSRLIAEAVQQARQRGVLVSGGECQSYGTNSSYLVWRNIWRDFFALDSSLPAAAQISTLTIQLARLDSRLLPRLPLLDTILNLELPDNELTETFEPKLRKAALEALLVDCLRARTAQTPLLLVLEDVHWIDRLSDDLLEVLGRSIAELPVLVLLAYRPPQILAAEALRVSEFSHFRELQLSSLPSDSLRELITLKLNELFGSDSELPAGLLAQIEASAQGNPFYAEELINYLRDRAIDLRDVATLERLELPPSLHSLILSRIDQLSEQQKSLLKVASVIGRLFRASILWGLSPFVARRAELQADLDTLSRLDLTPLDTPEPELIYLFKHVVTQEVAYESLPFATRAVLHGQIGAVIEHRLPEGSERLLDLLAYHYDRSDNEEKRRDYLLRAAARARRDYANTAAIDYYQRALPLLEADARIDPLLHLGKVLELTGAWDDAGARYSEALALAEQRADLAAQARCQIALADLLRRRGEFPQAAERAEQARLRFDQAGDQAGVARSLNVAGIIADLQGDFATATQRYEASLAGWRALDERAEIANLLSNLGMVASALGNVEQALQLQEESLALRRNIGDRWRIAYSLTAVGSALLDQGDSNAAIERQREALELMRQIGDRWMVGNILNNLANALRSAGEFGEARARYHESLSIYREFGDQWALAYLFEDVGLLAALQDQPERALRLVGAGAALREEIGAPLAPSEQTRLDELLAPARAALGAAANDAFNFGRSLSLETAIAYAQETE